MRRLVLLCRHGNTFNSGEKVFMVGAREDLPLTEHGCRQATQLGDVVKKWAAFVGAVFAGPLQRTARFASLLCAAAGVETHVAIDERLREFDYGAWSGLSNEEIARLSGEEALRRWQEESVRPPGITFVPDEATVRRQSDELLQELSKHEGLSIVVSSNGRLREFGKLVSPQSTQAFKVRTGAGCLLEFSGGSWSILGWDLQTEELQQLLEKNLLE